MQLLVAAVPMVLLVGRGLPGWMKPTDGLTACSGYRVREWPCVYEQMVSG